LTSKRSKKFLVNVLAPTGFKRVVMPCATLLQISG
jgi:hypothetical protein